MITDPRHGLPSASAFERLSACPPSHQMSLGMEDTESAAAASGTLIHAVLAGEAEMSTLSSDEEQTHDMCKAQADDLIAQYISNPEVLTLKEVRLGLTQFGKVVVVKDGARIALRFTGQADMIIIDGTFALILDYKTGRGTTADAVDNHQLMALAALVSMYRQIETAAVAIIQPWAGKPTVAHYDSEALMLAQNAVISTLSKAETSTSADAVAGDHCKWCSAKPVCPVMTGAVDRALKEQLDLMPLDQIGHYMNQLPQIEAFLKDLQQLAHWLIEEGKTIPGWKLVNKRATRQWVDAEKASKFMEDNGVIVHELKMKTPAAVEKELKKAKKELPDDLVVAVSSGSTLAPESDPRPSVLQIGQTLSKAMAKIQ